MSDANLPEVELEPNEDIIERTAPGEEPLWLWAQTCPLEDCPCRVALMVAASSREQLDAHAAVVREAWSEVEDAADFSARVPPNVIAFEIEIDSGLATMPLAEDEVLSPGVAEIVKRLDGELLDRLASLWYLGKDLEDLSVKALEPADIKDFKPGQLLAWDEVYEGARMDVFLMEDGSAVEAIDTYCVRPKCQCNDVHIQFYQLPDSLDGSPDDDDDATSQPTSSEPEHDESDLEEHVFLGTVGIKVEQPVSVTYQPAPNQSEALASMLRRYQERYPNWVERLAQRADAMAQFGDKLHAHLEQQRRKPWVSSSRKRRGARH
ncbi:MAG TPA: hypothetical protein VIV60_10340 [Polyangiaceae bacterium]